MKKLNSASLSSSIFLEGPPRFSAVVYSLLLSNVSIEIFLKY